MSSKLNKACVKPNPNNLQLTALAVSTLSPLIPLVKQADYHLCIW